MPVRLLHIAIDDTLVQMSNVPVHKNFEYHKAQLNVIVNKVTFLTCTTFKVAEYELRILRINM